MLKEIMSFALAQSWSAVSLVILFGFLALVWAWIFRPGSTRIYGKMAKMPLDEG